MVYTVSIIIDDGGPAGHVYVGLNDGVKSTEYGYNPVHSPDDDVFPTTIGDGKIVQNEGSSRNYQNASFRSYEITQSQYNSAKAKIQQIQLNPGQYDATQITEGSRNCVGFADEILKSAGISQGIGNIFTDAELSKDLVGLYIDQFYGDGSIIKNLWNNISNELKNMWNELMDIYKQVIGDLVGDVSAGMNNMSLKTQLITPIGLDLSGNGRIDVYSATSSLNKAFFDIDNDNFKEKVSWITGGDGWLAEYINTNVANHNFAVDIKKKVG